MMTSGIPDERRAGLHALAIALAAVAVVVAFRFRNGDFGESWGTGFPAINGADYHGRMARNLDRYGFGTLRFNPAINVIPTEPLTIQFFTNHPPLLFLVHGLQYRWFGQRPSILKMLEMAFFVLTVLCVTGLLAFRRPVAGAVAGVLTAALPLGSHYGFMVSTFGPCTLLAVAAVIAYKRWINTGRRSYAVLLALVVLLNCQCDWWAYSTFAALGLDTLIFRGRGWRRRFLLLVTLGVASILITMAYTCYVFGGVAAGFERYVMHFGRTMSNVADAAPGAEEWCLVLGRYFVLYVTIPALILAAIGAVRGVACGEGRLILMLVVVGTPHIFLFTSHAFGHDFWIYPLLPAIAVAGGLAVEPWIRSRWRALSIATIAGVLTLVIWSVHIAHGHDAECRSNQKEQVGRFLNGIVGPDDILLCPFSVSIVSYYVHGYVYGELDTVHLTKLMVDMLLGADTKGRVLYALPPPGITADSEEIAGYLSESFAVQRVGPLRIYVIRD